MLFLLGGTIRSPICSDRLPWSQAGWSPWDPPPPPYLMWSSLSGSLPHHRLSPPRYRVKYLVWFCHSDPCCILHRFLQLDVLFFSGYWALFMKLLLHSVHCKQETCCCRLLMFRCLSFFLWPLYSVAMIRIRGPVHCNLLQCGSRDEIWHDTGREIFTFLSIFTKFNFYIFLPVKVNFITS